MKEVINRIKEKITTCKFEIIAGFAFVAAFALTNQVMSQNEAKLADSRSVKEIESEISTEVETASEVADTEMETDSKLSEESQIDSALRKKGEAEKTAVIGKGLPKKTETEAEAETESETESETKAGIETEIETDFIYPMDIRKEDEGIHFYDLRDPHALYGFQPVFAPDVEKHILDLERFKKETIDDLKAKIENEVSEFDGDWSVYFKNLKTGEEFVVNDVSMKSASVMKLFIMGSVYKAIDDGEIQQTEEVTNWMNNMISVSDNDSANHLLYLLGDSDYEKGIQKVDEFIKEHGFSHLTEEYNGFNNAETVMDEDKFNCVSAKDCGKLLEDIYRRNWVSREVSNEIESMLLNQHTRYKIPAGLPEGVACGNKTGEMDTTENDAAIVYSKNCDYILVVLSSDWSSKNTAISRIASVSEMVYTFLNHSDK